MVKRFVKQTNNQQLNNNNNNNNNNGFNLNDRSQQKSIVGRTDVPEIEAGCKRASKHASAYSVGISQYNRWKSLIFEMYVFNYRLLSVKNRGPVVLVGPSSAPDTNHISTDRHR